MEPNRFWPLLTVRRLVPRRSISASSPDWEDEVGARAPVKVLAVVTLAIWLAVVFLGRLIAYDHVWGSLSPSKLQ